MRICLHWYKRNIEPHPDTITLKHKANALEPYYNNIISPPKKATTTTSIPTHGTNIPCPPVKGARPVDVFNGSAPEPLIVGLSVMVGALPLVAAAV